MVAVQEQVVVVTLTGTPTTTLTGNKSGEIGARPRTAPVAIQPERVHSSWWVGGNIALNSELPMSGKATYAGNAMGDVFNNLSGTLD
jgi:hypothetical protein